MIKQRPTFILFLFLIFSLAAFSQKNVTKPNVEGPMGFRVNTYTGNLFYQRQDLFIPGRGLDLDFTFTYNSGKRSRDWGMGKGWTFTYNMAYELQGQDVVVERMDGRKDHFAYDNGNYQSPTGLYEVLEQYESGKYRIRMKDGMLYFFDDPSHRRLTKMEDRYGNAITLSYTDSLLTTVTDASGRVVNLSWTGGHLATVTFSGITPARTYQYEYDNGQLFRMTNPMGFMVQYEYDDRGRMREMQDENGNPITILYDGNGAVRELNSCLSSMSITYNINSRKTYVVEKVGQGNQVTTYEYDEQGRLASQTGNCCGYNLAFEYDENNNIVKRTDANGNETIFNYDDNGNVIKEIDPLGNFVEYAYEPVYNQVSSVTDKRGNTTAYAYDGEGNLTQVDYPLGIQESFGYDNFGYQTSYTDGKGNVTSYEYDSNGYLTRITNPENGISLFSYDEIGNQLSTTDPNNNTTTRTYDANNRLETIADALNNTESYSYDNRGNRISFTDKNGNSTLYTYDALDRLTERQDALGHTEKFMYDSKGNLIKYIDQNQNSKIYEYDDLNRLANVTNAIGEVANYEYDGNGNLIGISLPNGNKIDVQYDALNRVIKISDSIGDISIFAYDENSNRTVYSDGNGNTVTYLYDEVNRITDIIDPFNEATSYSYDDNGNILNVSDRNENITQYAYDKLNRQVSLLDALNYITTYTYDDYGNLKTITDSNNNITTYQYNALNQLVEEVLPDGTFKTYTVSPTGQILSRVDNNGQTTIYTYDDVYRLISRNYPDGSNDEFTYDPAGNISQAQNGSAIVQFMYDALDRVVSETLNGKVTSYTYAVGQRQKIIQYPGGREIVEISDERGRLHTIVDNTFINDAIATYEYDPGDRVTARVYSNNTFTSYNHDANSRLTGVNHALGSTVQYNYTYDAMGNRLTEHSIHHPNNSKAFTYDKLNRLENVKTGVLSGDNVPNPNIQTNYNLDGLGNWLDLDSNGVLTTFTVNNLNQYIAINGTVMASLSYDNNGNLLTDGTVNFSYDYENRIATVGNANIAKYKYDPLGRRVKKIINNDTTYYFYDNLRVIEERGNGEIVKATHVFGGNLDEILSLEKNGILYYYHQDDLGSVTQITDSSGNIVEQYEYDAYGEVKVYDENYAPLAASTINNLYLYTGRRLDEESGLYYYRIRYYSTELGRFLHRDPLNFIDGINLYQYARSNPLSFIDPTGTQSICPSGQSPIPIPSPSGDCTHSEHRNLQDQVDKACKIKRSCNSSMSLAEIEANIVKNQACIAARQNINNKCFRGGDDGHQKAVEDAANALRKCEDIKERKQKEKEKQKEFSDNLLKAEVVTSAAIIIYFIVSEGSRILFPPRNLVPIW